MLVIKEIGAWQKSDKVDFRYRLVKIKEVAKGMKSFGGKANRGLEFTVVAWEAGTTFTVKETGESLDPDYLFDETMEVGDPIPGALSEIETARFVLDIDGRQVPQVSLKFYTEATPGEVAWKKAAASACYQSGTLPLDPAIRRFMLRAEQLAEIMNRVGDAHK
jgi:hypothetical protein